MDYPTLSFLIIAHGLLMALLGIPLAYDKVRPNRYYGFRVKETLANRDLWFTVNRRTGWIMLLWGAGCIPWAMAFRLATSPRPTGQGWYLLYVLAGLAFLLIDGYLTIGRHGRREEEKDDRPS